MNFLITAGPTQEPIDPVRYLSNHSSGKMGYALAQVAQQQGHNVTLISGPVALDCPQRVKRINVTTAEEMHQAVMTYVANCDVFISVAAVADYKAATISPQKLKKTQDTLQLSLVRNPDILSAVTQLKNPPFTVGFAAETENLRENALTKLKNKKLDMVVANDVSKKNSGFGSEQNTVIVLWKDGEQSFVLQPKIKLAEKILELINKKFLPLEKGG